MGGGVIEGIKGGEGNWGIIGGVIRGARVGKVSAPPALSSS